MNDIRDNRPVRHSLKNAAFAFFMLLSSMAATERLEPTGAQYESAGLYSHAILEYKRYIFLAERAEIPADAENYLGLARCLARTENYEKAMRAFEKFLEYKTEYTVEICALELTLMEKTGYAGFSRIRLFSLMRTPMPDDETRKQVLAANGKAAILSSEWKTARLVFSFLAKEAFISDEAQDRAEKIIFKADTLKPFSPAFSGVLSAMIPGLGQTVSGDPLDGLNAFALNASLAGLSIFSLASGDVIDFVFLEMPLFFRFYSGNIVNARTAARSRNDRKLSAMRESLVAILP